ncbi:MAG: hypothetical protein QXD43_03185 [Candidatus Aenigmatarchaeota archaeon]
MNEKIKVKIEKEFQNLEDYEKFLIKKRILEKDNSGKLKLSQETYAKILVDVYGLSIVFNRYSADEILKVCSRNIDETYGFNILKKTTSYQDLVSRIKELQNETKKVA